MPSYKPKVQILLAEEYHKKFKKLCELERRTDSVMGAIMIETYINNYETEHGEIEIDIEPKTPWEKQIKNISKTTQQPIKKTLKDSLKNGIELGNDAGDQVKKKIKKQN